MNQPDSPRQLPNNAVALAFRGLEYVFSAFGFIRRHKLWGLTAVSIGVNVVLLAALLLLTWLYLVPYVTASEAWIVGPSKWGQGFFDSTRVVLGWMVWFLGVMMLVSVNGVVLLLVGQAVASPFLDLLSEKVESIVLALPQEPFSLRRSVAQTVVGVVDLLWSLLYFLAVQVGLLLVGLIPAVGTVPATVGSFMFTSWLLAQEFVGLPMARQLISYRARWGAVWRNKSVSLGFGSGVMLLFIVPGLNLVLLPLATVGGTLLFCDLKASGRLAHLGIARVAQGGQGAQGGEMANQVTDFRSA